MSYKKKSYLEHTAIYVKDISWHIRFFTEALGMSLYDMIGKKNSPEQVWTIGGIQLISDPDFKGTEGRMAHLGIMTEDLESALKEVYKWEVTELPQGKNWVALPDGLCIELIQSKGDSVVDILAIDPRSDIR